MAEGELSAWLRLALTPHVGNDAARRLLAAYGLPQAIFQQSRTSLMHIVTERQAQALMVQPPEWAQTLNLTQDWLSANPQQRCILTLGDKDYPSSLLQLADPPLMLYLTGCVQTLKQHGWPVAMGMVGSRNPSPQGVSNAHAFAKSFVATGLCVVSGMALGVDAAAHEGALHESSAGRITTLAVVGTGLDRVYPKQHHELAHRIAAQGLLVSEFALGTPPLSKNFPKRNRLIAALSQGTLVVEAALQSGTLITARETVELGKDVFAIPGSIHSPQSKGCHALIKQGAKLVETAEDVLDELHWRTPMRTSDPPAPLWSGLVPGHANAASATQLAQAHHLSALQDSAQPDDHALLAHIGHDPVSLDALQARTGLATPQLQAQLLDLELAQKVVRLPGGLFGRLIVA